MPDKLIALPIQPTSELAEGGLPVLEGLAVPIWRSELSGECNFVNHAWRSMTGREQEQELALGWLEAFHPEDRDRFLRALRQAASSQRHFWRVVRVHTPDGQHRPAVASAKPAFDRSLGRVQYYGAISLSPGEANAEQALLETNRHLDQLEQVLHVVTQQAFTCMVYVSLGRLVQVNEAFEALAGETRPTLIGTSLREHFAPPEQFDAFEAEVASHMSAGQTFEREVQLRRADGTRRWCRMRAMALDPGEALPTSLWMFQDITHLKRTEQTLRTVTEQYRTIVETAPTPLVVMTLEGRPLLWNPAATQQLGLPEGAPELPCMAQVAEAFLRARGGAAVTGLPLRLTGDGERELVVDMRPFLDAQGRVEAVLLVAQDLTPLHRSLGQTVAAIARMIEFRDPYTAGHERRVAELAVALGMRLKLSGDRLEALRLASMVHDLGKLLVPAEILAKPTRLSPAEFTLIKQHAQAGYDILKDITFPWPLADMVRQHHERLDGSGYPQGLVGDEILLEARIMAVADVVEAMASHRPYRAALGIEPALAEIRRGAGTIFDPAVVEACEGLFAGGYCIES